MQHLVTRTPPHIVVIAQPSGFYGWKAHAENIKNGHVADAWAPTEIDARQRAETLVTLEAA